MDSGAWWAVVYGVAQSRTWLMRLSKLVGDDQRTFGQVTKGFSQLWRCSWFWAPLLWPWCKVSHLWPWGQDTDSIDKEGCLPCKKTKDVVATSPSVTATTPDCAPWRVLEYRKRGYWPWRVKVHSKGVISLRHRLLHLPTHRKAVNSLTWDIWFFFN